MFFANLFDSLFNFVASAYIFSFPFYLSYYLLSLVRHAGIVWSQANN